MYERTFAFVAARSPCDTKIATPVGTIRVDESATGWAHELSAGGDRLDLDHARQKFIGLLAEPLGCLPPPD